MVRVPEGKRGKTKERETQAKRKRERGGITFLLGTDGVSVLSNYDGQFIGELRA